MSTIDSGHTPSSGVLDSINGVANVDNVPNGISHKITPLDNHNHPSPATDSPATPADGPAPDVKIDMDYQEQESDARHEPLPIKHIDALDKHNTQDHPPSVHPGTSPLPTPPEDVNMTDTNGHINGHSEDVAMSEDTQTPAATPGISNEFAMASIDGGSSTSVVRAYPDDHDDQEPPAKRARVHSDADMASTTHSATPPPASALSTTASSAAIPPSTSASASTHIPPTPSTSAFPPGENTFSPAQYRFCVSTVRSLRKQKDAGPFLRPVDPVALNIPHYLTIIKNPMDLSTIERKLNSSNPAKPDPNPNNPRYYNTDEFISDFRQIIHNTLTFNGPDHVVTQMGKRLEEIFDKQIKQLPPHEPPAPVVSAPKPKPTAPKPKPPPPPRKLETPPPPPPAPVPSASAPVKKTQPVRRPSTSVPVIRRNEPEPVGRPKREIHPPPPKDLPYADAPRKNRKAKKGKDDGTDEQLRFCHKVMAEMWKKNNYRFAHPFYEPVDWQRLDIPSYPKIVKRPMDLLTMKKKLENNEYPAASNFYEDFKLMIRNCLLFNPAGTPVNLAGQELQRLFDDKWKQLPPLHPPSEDDDADDDDDEEESDAERARQRIAELEKGLINLEKEKESMKAEIARLKQVKPKKKPQPKKEEKEKPPVASTSKPAPAKPPKAPSKKKQKKTVSDDDVLSFDQKKDLSDAIGKLEGARLERVIQIIHEGVPEIRDSTEEIELEIDQLPAAVLTKLYNFVLRPLRQPPPNKRSRSGKGTGTGGLKRKSMDEEKEAEKIRQLEERMALFEGASAAPMAPRRDVDSDRSSDSSDSDSSGSDSE